MRAGRPGVSIPNRHGNVYPMDYAGATILHPAVHTNPRVWPGPEQFIPDRFLVGAEHALHVKPAAYRPFKQGPRNCIDQTLVFHENSVAIIMVVRKFDIMSACEEWDAVKQREMGVFARLKTMVFREPVKTVHGDRAYQTGNAGTYPADGYSCRVSLRRS